MVTGCSQTGRVETSEEIHSGTWDCTPTVISSSFPYAVGKPVKYVKKDIKKMIMQGLVPGGACGSDRKPA